MEFYPTAVQQSFPGSIEDRTDRIPRDMIDLMLHPTPFRISIELSSISISIRVWKQKQKGKHDPITSQQNALENQSADAGWMQHHSKGTQIGIGSNRARRQFTIIQTTIAVVCTSSEWKTIIFSSVTQRALATGFSGRRLDSAPVGVGVYLSEGRDCLHFYSFFFFFFFFVIFFLQRFFENFCI
jgi:hypothetical protein